MAQTLCPVANPEVHIRTAGHLRHMYIYIIYIKHIIAITVTEKSWSREAKITEKPAENKAKQWLGPASVGHR